jgi:hypothetical protein
MEQDESGGGGEDWHIACMRVKRGKSTWFLWRNIKKRGFDVGNWIILKRILEKQDVRG